MTQTDASNWSPFLKWGHYKSTDENSPDVLNLKVTGTETFETKYSTNVNSQLKNGHEWNDVVIPLKFHESNNASLVTQWMKYLKKGLLKEGKEFKLKTWLGTSMKTERPIRRFAFEFE